ncbi:SNF2 family N-terminal domain-containing protein [Xylaria telfairii]|nr:SNF2 family N-terminal domain-containing protein [Xylaria telfairii]
MDTNSLLCNTPPATGSKRPSPSPVTQDSEGKRARLLSYEEALPGKTLDHELPLATNEFREFSQNLHETETRDIFDRDQVLPSILYSPSDRDNISLGDNYFCEDQVKPRQFMDFCGVDDLLKDDSDEHVAGNNGVLYGTNASQHGHSVTIRSQASEATTMTSSALAIEESINICIDYDTCFGVIIATPTSSFGGDFGAGSLPVKLKPLGGTFLLYGQDSGAYLGSLNNSRLVSALSRLALRLDATLFASEIKDTGGKKKKAQMKKHSAREAAWKYSIRIVLHGMQYDKETTGSLLADSGIFLQHPSIAEIIPEVRYDNPHYLVRPGAEMPDLEQLHLDDTTSSTETELVMETRKGRFIQILETAKADGESVTSINVTPSPRLRSPLMRHQVLALAMMLEKESGFVEEPTFPSLWRKEFSQNSKSVNYRHTITRSLEPKPVPALGGILADDMGLGKTLSMLSLICTSLDLDSRTKDQDRGVRQQGTLIIAPTSAINGWMAQVSEHIHKGTTRIVVYHGPDRKSLANHFGDFDIIITTYKILLMEPRTGNEGGPLFSWNWLRVVLDEAHHIRNRSSETFQSVCALKSRYRWCLTGTPIHNCLDDYGALLSFIRVFPFIQKSNFMSWIVKPVEEKHSMAIERLQELIRATCLRRMKEQALSSEEITLPQRSEMVHEVHLHQDDQNLYDAIKTLCVTRAAGLQAWPKEGQSTRSKDKNILLLINSMRLVCNHGKALLPQAVIPLLEKSLVASFDSSTKQIHFDDFSAYERGNENNDFGTDDQTPISVQYTTSRESSQEIEMEIDVLGGEDVSAYRPSAKVLAILQNLERERAAVQYNQTPRKSVVFSYWVKMLDLVAQALRREHIVFQRIDGKTSLKGRQAAMQEFNDNLNCTVLLASTGSSAEGVNLTAAGIVHLLEPHWNPMVEAQAVDRVYRIGQKQEVTVIRYIVPNSIERYVQVLQQEKLRLINQTVNMDEVSEADLESRRWKV